MTLEDRTPSGKMQIHTSWVPAKVPDCHCSSKSSERKQWGGSREAPCGMVNNQRVRWRFRDRETQEVSERSRKNNVLWQRYIEHQMQNTITRGQVNSRWVPLFSSTLTLLQNVERKTDIHELNVNDLIPSERKLQHNNCNSNHMWWKRIQSTWSFLTIFYVL